LLILFLVGLPKSFIPYQTIYFGDKLSYAIIALSAIFKTVFHYRFKKSYLTISGLFYSNNQKKIDLTRYNDYLYDARRKRFILTIDKRESLILTPKTPVEPYEGVLIDLFESQLAK